MGLQETANGTLVADLEPRLEALLSRQTERLPFLHPAWLRIWLSEFGDHHEPLLLTCSDGEILGLAPLMRHDDQLSFIGDSSICDFMDVLVDPDRATTAWAVLERRDARPARPSPRAAGSRWTRASAAPRGMRRAAGPG